MPAPIDRYYFMKRRNYRCQAAGNATGTAAGWE